MKVLIVLVVILLGGCSLQQQKAVNEAVVSQQQSADRARTEAVKSCAQSSEVAACMLGVGLAFGSGANAVALPVVSSDLQGFAGLVGVVAPVAGAVMQSAYARDVSINANNNATAQNAAQWAGISSISSSAAQAQSNTAQAAILGITRVSESGFDAVGSATNGASQALAFGFSALPNMLPSINAGGSVIQGNANDLSTRRDTFGNGARNGSSEVFNMSEYRLVCTAAPAGNGGNGPTGGAGGGQLQTCQMVPR